MSAKNIHPENHNPSPAEALVLPRPAATRQEERTPERAFTFLKTLGTTPSLRARLASTGYTDEEHARGWELLLAIALAPPTAVPAAQPNVVRSAVERLTAWASPTLRRIRLGLARLHPEQEAFVFDGVGPTRGEDAVLAVATFLARCHDLASGERKATRKEDRAALETIAARGAPHAVRQELAALVDVVLAHTSEPSPEPQAPSPAFGQRRVEQLRALHAWYADWSETARTVITRKSDLIRLGLAKRRPPKVVLPTPAAAPPAPTVPSTGGTVG